ncbi:hypothetical protein [Paramagnetospirillum magneticum]|uniref:hypothetical protein n=1 Tax=Paramagnetospirillum magneticum TaxID=84159 RepID=UPI0005C13E37|nr:hypothetical protein [Paramagnetospirillum magneticum]
MTSDNMNSEIQVAQLQVRHILEQAVASSDEAWETVLRQLMDLTEHHKAHGLEDAALEINAAISRIYRLRGPGLTQVGP